MRRYVAEIVAGCGWHDAELFWKQRRLRRAIRAARFDAAILLTNSFRSALAVWMARVPRRIGYAREGRALLLTERLKPLRQDGQFVPSPMLDYYAALAAHVGGDVSDRRLRLGITPPQQQATAELQRHYGLADGRPYAVVNPGAAFGAAKCWLPERFAGVCDGVREKWGLTPVLVGAPGEVPLLRRIAALASPGAGAVCCDDPPTTLGSLKGLIRDAALLVCNDTGPRHYGNAFGVPTVTVFGSTIQEWTDTGYAGEIKLQARVECGPCMLRTCPIDHRCMTLISVAQVIDAAEQLLSLRDAAAARRGQLAVPS
ncbi:MAG: hypothetical protein CHACPFDD_02532 [Phycisphaerae bacterium]|nr:hypothetical protein [Phycisphaerae bacterium]